MDGACINMLTARFSYRQPHGPARLTFECLASLLRFLPYSRAPAGPPEGLDPLKLR